jgi:hypothetical protein
MSNACFVVNSKLAKLVEFAFGPSPGAPSQLLIAAIDILNFRKCPLKAKVRPSINCVFEEEGMKKPILLASMAVALMWCLTTSAQDVTQAQRGSHRKPGRLIRVSGKLGNTSDTFADDMGHRIWVIVNSEVLKGYEGQELVLRGRVESEANRLEVIEVRPQSTYTANWGDSAFRR